MSETHLYRCFDKEETLLYVVTVTTALALASHVAFAQQYAIVPDPTLSPGAIRTTHVNDICSHGTFELRHWSKERDRKIMQEYNVTQDQRWEFELDHLVPLGIGGAGDDKNLWAEPRASIEKEWPAEKKDELEWTLRQLVCDGQLDIRVAQAAIRDDWISAYKLYVGGRRARDETGYRTGKTFSQNDR